MLFKEGKQTVTPGVCAGLKDKRGRCGVGGGSADRREAQQLQAVQEQSRHRQLSALPGETQLFPALLELCFLCSFLFEFRTVLSTAINAV